MIDNQTTLRECPFCGGEAKVVKDCEAAVCWCPSCHVSTRWAINEHMAIELWNTRATHGTLTAEQVREAVLKRGNVMGPRFYGDWQAVADELNAAIDGTKCENYKSMRTFDSMETALTIAEKEVEIEKLRRENAELCDENAELARRRAELEAATLGGGTLTAEQVKKAIYNCSTYVNYDGCVFYASGIRMQAIADELNAKLGSGTCELVYGEDDEGYDGWHCQSCGGWFDAVRRDGKLVEPRHCQECGKAVKR